MNRSVTKFMPWAVLAAGVVGAICRGILFASGVDGKGLLISNHFAYSVLWALCALVAAMLLFGTWNLRQATKYRFNFPRSLFGSLGAAAAGICLLFYSLMPPFAQEDGLSLALGLVGILAAAAFVFLSYCRWKGLRPGALFYVILCVYFMLDLVHQYRLWSADPQLQDYVFSLLALVFVLLSCYYNATFASGDGNRKAHTFTHLAGVFCCVVTIPQCDAPLLYAALGLWLFTNLCNLTPLRMPREKEEG